MTHSGKTRWGASFLALVAVLACSVAGAAITKTIDRKLPLTYCPFDLNGWQDGGNPVGLSFVAPSSSIRITLSAPNYYNGAFVNTHIDNLAVVLKSQFPDNPANVHYPIPGGTYADCYAPPGTAQAPSFLFANFSWPGPAGPLLNLFDSTSECWSGNVYFDSHMSAPRNPATETDTSGGSLGIGLPQQQLPALVSATRIVTGLVTGQPYVVFGWWHAEQEGVPLTLTIDAPTCVDGDADGFVDCSGCAPCQVQAGQTCGDCNDANAAIRPTASDSTCDGIDENCSGQADEGFAGGCQCIERGSGIVGWWPAEGNAQDRIGSNDGTLTGVGTGFTNGFVGQTFFFSLLQPGGVELPDAPELEFTSAMTLEAWIHVDELSDSRPILSKIGPNEYAYGLSVEPTGFLESTISSNGTGADGLTSPNGAIALGAWAHVATTFDAGKYKLYVNGQVVASKTSTITSLYDQGSIHPNIGRLPSGSQEFVGYIDEPAMYSRALSDDEIRAIHDAGSAGMCQCTDADHDGYGTDGRSCPGGTQLDCAGANPAIHPGAVELCNDADDDCDTLIDEGLPQSTFYLDQDGDGYGSPTWTVQHCGSVPAGYASNGADCNDGDPSIHPGSGDATCDGIDNDCDAQVDEAFPGGCQCTEPAPGLVSWWPAESSANDVRSLNHGTLTNGATYATGKVGQAFSFDGIDDYVTISVHPDLDFRFGDFTIETWVYLNSLSVDQEIFHKVSGTVPNDQTYFLEFDQPGALRFMVRAGVSNQNDLTVPITLQASHWYHVAAVRSGNTSALYLDGSLLGSQSAGAAVDTGQGGAARIGSMAPNGTGVTRPFFGRIDELTIHGRALRAAEIRAIFDAGSVPLCRCVDADLDGYGSTSGLTCPAGTQPDCNDGATSTHPGAAELCNGVDDDCDTTLDEGLSQSTFYRDVDGDGYGAVATTIQACASPAGYVSNSADCNDALASIHPGVSDAVCDGVDQNCSGTADDGYVSPPDGWIATPLTNAPSARRLPTMVSTGNSVIVWGGIGTATNIGGIYRPRDVATDAWSSTSSSGAPAATYQHTAVWTGTEMIVWGGVGVGNVGGRYNPVTDAWAATTTSGAPSARARHTAVWTGSRMVVWGGGTSTGGIYNPDVDGWSAVPTLNAPGARYDHTAVVVGDKMVVWGGVFTVQLATGGRFNLATGAWDTTAMAASPLSARSRHTAVSTGTKMIVWGGYDGASALSDGAIYDPATNAWVLLPAGPPARYEHTAIWDAVDNRMVIAGGFGAGVFRNDAWAYSPASNTWIPLTTVGAPSARYDHAAAWLSATREMVIWGGWGAAGPSVLNTGGRIVVAPFSCGVGTCGRASSYTCSGGQLGYGCTPGAPSAEVCNGLDDDCDATVDDGIAAPTGRPTLTEAKSPGQAVLSWTSVSGTTGYDVVRGSLSALRSSAGNFATSTTGCLGNNVIDLFTTDTSTPVTGDGVWHLVRAVNACGGNGSYDEGVPSQQSSRDAEIAASGVACP